MHTLLGHHASECTSDRADYLAGVRAESPENAWELIKDADEAKDLFLLREVSPHPVVLIAMAASWALMDITTKGRQDLRQGRA